jgi:hypothetical protein
MGAVELMNTFATIACLISAIFGATAILLPTGQPIDTIVLCIAWVWILADAIVNRAHKAEYWRGLNRTFPEIFRDAKEGTLPRSSALQLVTSLGSMCVSGRSDWIEGLRRFLKREYLRRRGVWAASEDGSGDCFGAKDRKGKVEGAGR